MSCIFTGIYPFFTLKRQENARRSQTVSIITSIRIPTKAYIITNACGSVRFNFTKQNIERVFPNFFDIECYLMVPLSDRRIHKSSVDLWQKFSSNQLTFIDLWTSVIPAESKRDKFQWSFIFEDDVDFNDPGRAHTTNYVAPLMELMENPQVRMNDGFIYLGMCAPNFTTTNSTLIMKNTNETLTSQRAHGFCLHATGITAARSLLFWSHIASFRPNPDEVALDHQVREYSIRSNTNYYIFGSNFRHPPETDHHGIAFQDRERFLSTIS